MSDEDVATRLRRLRDEAQAELDALGIVDEPTPPTDIDMMKAAAEPGRRQAVVRGSIAAKRRAFRERFEVDHNQAVTDHTDGDAA